MGRGRVRPNPAQCRSAGCTLESCGGLDSEGRHFVRQITSTARGRARWYNGPLDAFDLPALLEQLDASRPDFSHFFATETLSLTVASWPAGSTDDQTPHAEDEVYFLAAGRGVISVAGAERPVGPGAVVYVAAGVEHHFHSITENLHVLVFWSPPRAAARPLIR